MTAQILLLLMVQSMFGSTPVTLLIPIKSMAYCEEWKADPAPIIPAGARLVQINCIDLAAPKPSDEKPA